MTQADFDKYGIKLLKRGDQYQLYETGLGGLSGGVRGVADPQSFLSAGINPVDISSIPNTTDALGAAGYGNFGTSKRDISFGEIGGLVNNYASMQQQKQDEAANLIKVQEANKNLPPPQQGPPLQTTAQTPAQALGGAQQGASPQGGSLSDLVGTRPSQVNPATTEYFNKQTGQGFSTPDELFKFASATGQQYVNFEQINQALQTKPTKSVGGATGGVGGGTKTGTKAEVATVVPTPVADDTRIKKEADVNNLLSSYGISTSATEKDPIKYVQDIYSQVYSTLGVSAAKEQTAEYNKQLLDLRNKKTDEAALINDNPWLTEGVRVGRLSKLEEKYAQKEGNLIAYLQLNESIYERGLQQAQFLSGQALDVYQTDQQFNRQLALDAVNFNQQLQLNSIQRAEKESDARAKLASNLPFYKFPGSPLAYETKTGKPVDYNTYLSLGGNGQFTDIYEIPDAGKAEEKTIVLDMLKDYPDAGIQINDSLAVAQSKLGGSRIYGDKVRPPSTGGGGGGLVGGTVGGGTDNFSILANALSNRLGSVAAKKSFEAQYNRAATDDERLRILAANAPLSTEMRNGLVQNAQVSSSLDSVLNELNKGVQTGLLQAGQSYIANKLGSGGDKQVEKIKSMLVTAVQPYRNKVTGAAWGDQEEAEYQALIGSVRFAPEDLANKLNTFKNTLRQQSLVALQATIDPLGATLQDSNINFADFQDTQQGELVVVSPDGQRGTLSVDEWPEYEKQGFRIVLGP